MQRVGRPWRRLVWLLATVGVAAIAAVPAAVDAATPGARTAASKTTARIYRAFTRHGHSVFRTRARSGSCFVVSITAERRDGWRCTAKHFIYDPCFSSSKARGVVLCPDAPWASTGVRIRLTAPLPQRFGVGRAPSTRSRPWALELFDGRRCQLVSGASSVVQGQRLNYLCGRGRDGLWGLPDRGSQPWTILTAPDTASALTQRASIRKAWM